MIRRTGAALWLGVTLCTVGAASMVDSSAAQAAVVKPLDLPTLTARAQIVALGRVTASEARWREGRIVTTVAFAPSQTLKGPAQEALQVEILGGEVEGIAQKVSGMPQFEVGEEVVLFLRPKGAVHQVVGLAQGKFTVSRAAEVASVRADLQGLTQPKVAAAGVTTLEALPAAPAVALSQFLADIQRHVETP